MSSGGGEGRVNRGEQFSTPRIAEGGGDDV
jgi:hypothetical protein